jgi:hypothetical protein
MIEEVYQSLPGGISTSLAPKLPHLTDSDALFLGGLTLIPRDRRPHGIITWASEIFGLSRPSVYSLGKRIKERLLPSVEAPQLLLADVAQADLVLEEDEMAREVRRRRLQRTIMAATFPGNMSIRSTQTVLLEALGRTPSIGTISELRLEMGRQAGRLMAELEYSQIGPVIVGRDETFFQGTPILLVIEPVSSTILFAFACKDRKAETWGAALELLQEQGASIVGLVEDMARAFGKSQKLANLTDIAVQKDTWHLMQSGSQVCQDLKRSAYKAMTILVDLENKLRKEWDEAIFEKYIEADTREEKAISQYDTYAALLHHLNDSLEMVDWRSGEIRDVDTADWLLTETLLLMEKLTDKRVVSFVRMVRNHQSQLLTCLRWIAARLPDWQSRLANLLPLSADAHSFQSVAARHWRLQQMLINGHKEWRTAADESALELDEWLEVHPALASFVAELMHIFDSAGHTNSINECVNGILKSFLDSRHSFRNLDTLQAYLDLFVLWHNMRIFQRGKRKGKSPFQIAGIQTESQDWLTLLGF